MLIFNAYWVLFALAGATWLFARLGDSQRHDP
jgi:hypothetical protein